MINIEFLNKNDYVNIELILNDILEQHHFQSRFNKNYFTTSNYSWIYFTIGDPQLKINKGECGSDGRIRIHGSKFETIGHVITALHETGHSSMLDIKLYA